VSVTDSTSSSTTDDSGYSGSGLVGTSLVQPLNSVVRPSFVSAVPALTEGVSNLNDSVSRFNNFLRMYSLHLNGPHQNVDEVNVILESDFSSIDLADLDLAVSGVYTKIKNHFASGVYHYAPDYDFPVIDGLSLGKKIDILIESFRRHTKSNLYHQYVYGDLVPAVYKSVYHLETTQAEFGSSIELKGNFDKFIYDPRNQYYINSSNEYSFNLQNLLFPASISGVWFQDGLKWSESGVRLAKDVLSVYFSGRMDTSNVDSVGVSISPSVSILNTSWGDDTILNMIIPDLSEVEYSLTFSGLKDINGNLVT
jgi:hypothetical protein